MFSKACEYALKVMIYLAAQPQADRLVGLKEIAQAIDSPTAFTAKITRQLVKSKLLQSLRGPTGGFRLRKDKAITLLEIVTAIDGEGIFKNCVLGLEECSAAHPCPIHDKFRAVRDQLTKVLTTTTIDEAQEGIQLGNSFLKV